SHGLDLPTSYYYCAHPDQQDQQVQIQPGQRIVPSTQHHLFIAPSFLLAVKDPDGSPSVTKNQACYSSAQKSKRH
ncbi:hypothetical protein F4823DRAFT_593647, partial [Ustulina deusta]